MKLEGAKKEPLYWGESQETEWHWFEHYQNVFLTCTYEYYS